MSVHQSIPFACCMKCLGDGMRLASRVSDLFFLKSTLNLTFGMSGDY